MAGWHIKMWHSKCLSWLYFCHHILETIFYYSLFFPDCMGKGGIYFWAETKLLQALKEIDCFPLCHLTIGKNFKPLPKGAFIFNFLCFMWKLASAEVPGSNLLMAPCPKWAHNLAEFSFSSFLPQEVIGVKTTLMPAVCSPYNSRFKVEICVPISRCSYPVMGTADDFSNPDGETHQEDGFSVVHLLHWIIIKTIQMICQKCLV